jgi:hypothetical protein
MTLQWSSLHKTARALSQKPSQVSNVGLTRDVIDEDLARVGRSADVAWASLRFGARAAKRIGASCGDREPELSGARPEPTLMFDQACGFRAAGWQPRAS